ncbi:MAG: hypothetical protein ABT15_15325 [Pseudonocardia sp. SCN 73-27]|nr:MAG: hypothetical protein ABS80_16505 [Pseudonocardia sp. SCN 72-51]ODV05814.1 MAG: hypothetical protein ABT15_15325 [Pseudonocardia sp. SCN 73-27]
MPTMIERVPGRTRRGCQARDTARAARASSKVWAATPRPSRRIGLELDGTRFVGGKGVEAVGVVELALVAVGRAVDQEHALTRRDRDDRAGQTS